MVDSFCEIKFKKIKFVPGKTAIPCSGRVIDTNEVKNMVNASLDAWLTPVDLIGNFKPNYETDQIFDSWVFLKLKKY